MCQVRTLPPQEPKVNIVRFYYCLLFDDMCDECMCAVKRGEQIFYGNFDRNCITALNRCNLSSFRQIVFNEWGKYVSSVKI